MFEMPVSFIEYSDPFSQACNSDELSYAIESLDMETHPFHFFDLNFSAEQRLFLSQIEISEENDFVTDLSDLYRSDLNQTSLWELSKNLIQCPAFGDQYDCLGSLFALISNKIEYLSNYVDLDEARLLLIASKAGNIEGGNYEWHRDPTPFEGKERENLNFCPNTNVSYSFIFNLVGESTTAFYLPTKDEYDNSVKYSELGIETYLSNEKLHSSRISSPNLGQAAVFFAGEIAGTIHSAPKSYDDRFVVAIFTQAYPKN